MDVVVVRGDEWVAVEQVARSQLIIDAIICAEDCTSELINSSNEMVYTVNENSATGASLGGWTGTRKWSKESSSLVG